MMLLVTIVLVSFITLTQACASLPPPPPPTTSAPVAPPVQGSCTCGRSSMIGSRIVGGTNAAKGELPWQVGLVSNNGRTPFCGGTLLSSDTVLTAAHCKTSVSNFQVVVGEHDVTRSDGEQRIRPSAWIQHENYNSRTTNYDFAIVKLASPVAFSDRVNPICLPSSTKNYDSVLATVSGWGTLYSGGSQPSILQKVNVPTMSNGQCMTNTAYGRGDITAQMICAADSNKDSCQGDSGGPMVTNEGNHFSIIGVVSWGYGCAQANAPGVYARVTNQLGWIQSKISGTTCPKP